MKPSKVIGPPDDPYMLRWNIIRVGKLPRVYLHRFCRSDEDRAPHDHPWWFISIILRGRYIEMRPEGNHVRRAGSVAFRRATDRHRIVLFGNTFEQAGDPETGKGFIQWHVPYKPVWTLFITGPVRRHWGFWCPGEHFVPAAEFDGCDDISSITDRVVDAFRPHEILDIPDVIDRLDMPKSSVHNAVQYAVRSGRLRRVRRGRFTLP